MFVCPFPTDPNIEKQYFLGCFIIIIIIIIFFDTQFCIFKQKCSK